jgi:uncharacterized RDD family membrane protein YckC
MTEIPDKFNLLKMVGIDGSRRGPDKKYASFNIRMLAATVDSFLAMITLGPLLDSMMHFKPLDALEMQQKMMEAGESGAARVLVQALHESGYIDNVVLQSFILLAVSGICWHYWAATPGKMLFRLKVVDAKTEAPISDSQIILRLFGYILSMIPIGLGFFWVSFDKRRQGWHDKFAGTVVIFTPRKAAARPSIPQEPSESA